jgi:hypothetical protein
MASFKDTWVSEKHARAHYAAYSISIENDRMTAKGKALADFVVSEGPLERWRHTMLACDGKYGRYNIVTRERERFVVGGEHVKERLVLDLVT